MRRFEENQINLNSSNFLVPNLKKPTRLNPLYESCKVMNFSQNQGFTMQEEIKSNFSSQENSSEDIPSLKEKKINFVKASLMVSTKRSISNHKKKTGLNETIKIEENQMIAKSENSFSLCDSESENKEGNQDALQEKLSINDPEEDAEVYYMKKVRILQTKFKKYKLDSQTEIMKLRNQNKKIKNQINQYKEFIESYQNDLKQKFQEFQKQKEINMWIDSDSSSSNDDDNSMPMISQIMEVKLEGKKLCDRIRVLQRNIKLEKSINIKMKEDIQKLNEQKFPQNNLKASMRKWSIQAFSPRVKKQSFHISKISTEPKENPISEISLQKNPEKEQKPKKCKQCEKLKNHIVRLNNSIQKIHVN